MNEKQRKFSFTSFDSSHHFYFHNISEDILKLSKRVVKFFINFKSIRNCRYYLPNFLKKKLKGNLNNIRINLSHLAEFDPYLYFKTQKFPTEMMSIFDFAVNNFFLINNKFKKNFIKKRNKVFFFNNTEKMILEIGSLGPKNLNKLITVKGIVSKFSPLIPELTAAFFRCEICCFEIYSFIEKGKMIEPVYCVNCKHFHSFQIIYQRSNFVDKQFILLQQIPKTNFKEENLSTLVLVAANDIKTKIQIGDYIEATGILRISSSDNQKFRNLGAFFQFYLEIFHIKSNDDHFLNKKNAHGKKFKKKNFKKIGYEILIMKQSLIQNSNIYLNYIDPVFPDLIGFETLKLGILSSIIQFNEYNFQKKNVEIDKIINILFIGKPGIAKSKILLSIINLTKSAYFINGNGKTYRLSSDLDPILNHERPKNEEDLHFFFSGNKKLMCIDRINELPEDVLILVEESIKNKSLSFAKAGFVCTIKKKISFIGTIDFIKDEQKLFLSSTNFFFQNFDFAYFIKDPFSSFQDKRLANHVLSLYFQFFKKETPEKKKFFGTGLKTKVLLSFLYSFQNCHFFFFPEFCAKEMTRWKIICTTIKKLKFGKKCVEDAFIWEFLITMSKFFCRLRFSNFIGLEDIRNAGILFLEALSSKKF